VTGRGTLVNMRVVLGSPTRRWVALGLAVLIVVAAAVLFWPRSTPVPVRSAELTIPGAKAPWDDAAVTLDATIYLPPVTPAPAVIMAHGFGGSKASVVGDAEELARAGFVVLAYSARGFGRSTGTISLDSLDAEVPDARAVVDYLANRQEVQQDAPGDPRIGVTGGSYGGALSLMLAGIDPRIDAAVPLITWNDLEHSLFPNAVQDKASAYVGTPAAIAGSRDGVFKKYWAAAMISSVVLGSDLSPNSPVDLGPAGGGVGGRRDGGSSAADPSAATGAAPNAGAPGAAGSGSAGVDPGCGRLRLQVCAAYAQVADSGRVDAAMHALLARSSPAAVVGKITAPTLLVQGEQDTLFPLDQADANARAIAATGTTVALDWYRGGHDGGTPDPDTRARITGWFQHYLAGAGAAPSTGFRYSVDGGLTDSGRARTRTLQTDGYPGLAGTGSVARQQVPLTGGAQVVLNPPGGSPAAISSLPGLARAGSLSSLLSSGVPGQSATFTSAPFGQLAVITGSATVSLSVAALASVTTTDATTGGPVLFAAIGSRTAGGLVTMGGSAVSPIRLPTLPADGSATTVTVDLPAVSLQVAQGDQLIVRFTTTDQAYSGPTAPAVYRISGADTVSLPVAGGLLVSAGEVPIGTLIGLIVLAVVAGIGLLLAGRRRRGSTLPALATDEPAVPLVIEHLSKSYPGGVLAVQDVSFEVLPGQVLGLLGPNGAGKTTTLRMVMGLIRPTGGSIKVFGHPVHPGAEILSRIGSFVEGSGFLPHLSGQVNLELYWRATGRPATDAHLDEVLSIAGLGTAVHRRVKTYSQGMRQRLAIAQSMLGLPDLLLLDEPTNGLDPPQIHAMREVLRRYAGTGRTVLVSSHLLSEVEQTCGDVVVIHQGRTIADGRVADLVATSGEMTFTVDDPEAAAKVLRELAGVAEVDIVDGAVQVDLGSVPASVAIAASVSAGISVSAAAPRNRLEDVFLDLVGATGTAPQHGDS